MPADIEFVKSVVVEAGKRAARHWGHIAREYKADESLVTQADRDSERFIEAELGRAYPGYAFVGEEYGWRGPRGVPVWACDPIDGTTNFVCGLPHWGVSVGLIDGGVPRLGALYLPVLDELFWAVRGGGAFCNGVPLACQDRDALHVEDPVCFTSNATKTLPVDRIAGRLRCLGSIASELAYLARGNLAAVVGLHEGIVDIAAGLCLCFEVGCEFRYLDGPAVDIADLLERRQTDRPFVYAPPRLATFLQRTLQGG